MTSRQQRLNPAGRQVHIDQEPHPLTGQVDFASLCETGGEGKRLTDIRFLKIREVSHEIFDRALL
jgi:hypothetical protein